MPCEFFIDRNELDDLAYMPILYEKLRLALQNVEYVNQERCEVLVVQVSALDHEQPN